MTKNIKKIVLLSFFHSTIAFPLSSSFKQAKADGFGTKARNAAINCTVGDVIVPLVSDLVVRQSLANRGVYAGVEYGVSELTLANGESIKSLEGLDLSVKADAVASIRPRYPLREYLERSDWPVKVPLDDVPLWVSRSTYEAGTGTLFFSLASFSLAAFVAFFVQFVSVPSPSMVPALEPGNVVLVTRTVPIGPFKPRVGDVIFFNAPPNLEKVAQTVSEQTDIQPSSTKGLQFIKRVAAVPGESVGVRHGEPFAKLSTTKYRFDIVGPYARPEVFPATAWDRPPSLLSKDEYFVSGDNGYRSVDSRVWGPLREKYIVGTARLVVWPIKDFGTMTEGEIKEVEIPAATKE